MRTLMGQDIAHAASLLTAGQLVAIPTETVYGLAGNALDGRAVAEIFSVKNRPSFNPLIVHGHSAAQLAPYVKTWPTMAQTLADAFWPGPLTLLLSKTDLIPDLVTAGNERVAIRVPNHPFTLSLLRQLAFPVAAPSANPFNYISPTSAQHVHQQLAGKLPYILDGGPTQVGLESTIVGWEAGQLLVYRVGGLSLEDIASVAGTPTLANQPTSSPSTSGMLKRHYSPHTRIHLSHVADWPMHSHGKIATLTFQSPPAYPAERHFLLSPAGDLAEAAQHLFALLREIDALGFDLILAEPVPDMGLGRAINDRLRRASA